MIQINLVPDVKQEMLRAQRMRNVTISLSIVVGVIALAVVAVLLIVIGTQAAVQSIGESNVNDQYKKLSSVADINDMLTLQNQLGKISSINDKKTMDSRLLDLLVAINPQAPNDMKLSKVTVDPTASTLTIEGSAQGGYPATEVFRKTILNTTIEGKETNSTTTVNVALTSDVTLQNTSYGQDASGNKVVRFTVVFTYPQGLFDNTLSQVKVVTPTSKVDVTDSKTRVPDSLFSQAASATQGGQ